jgi:hypothetical protein
VSEKGELLSESLADVQFQFSEWTIIAENVKHLEAESVGFTTTASD